MHADVFGENIRVKQQLCVRHKSWTEIEEKKNVNLLCKLNIFSKFQQNIEYVLFPKNIHKNRVSGRWVDGTITVDIIRPKKMFRENDNVRSRYKLSIVCKSFTRVSYYYVCCDNTVRDFLHTLGMSYCYLCLKKEKWIHNTKVISIPFINIVYVGYRRNTHNHIRIQDDFYRLTRIWMFYIFSVNRMHLFCSESPCLTLERKTFENVNNFILGNLFPILFIFDLEIFLGAFRSYRFRRTILICTRSISKRFQLKSVAWFGGRGVATHTFTTVKFYPNVGTSSKYKYDFFF